MEYEEVLESSPEEVVEEVSEDVQTPNEPAPKAEKTVPYSRFKEVNDKLKELKEQPVKVVNQQLNVSDYIDISASLEGLDQREKEYLAQQHKFTGKSLKEIRNDEDFSLWQSAYRAKQEKELLTLKPNGTQSESDRPMSFTERLASTQSVAEKEKLLSEQGLYKSPRPKTDRIDLGRGK